MEDVLVIEIEGLLWRNPDDGKFNTKGISIYYFVYFMFQNHFHNNPHVNEFVIKTPVI